MWSILKRELRAYFHSPLGYVFIGAVSVFTGYYFYSYNLSVNTTDMETLFSLLFPVIMFMVPVLTMRLLSEDKRLKIDQQLFTLPLTKTGIVLGKYFAAVMIYTIAISFTMLAAALMSFFGKVVWSEVIGNFVGLFLLGATLIAICLFVSSLTESQVVAAVLGFMISMFLMLTDAFVYIVKSDVLKALFYGASIRKRYMPFTFGVLEFSGFVFFISTAVLFLCLTVAVLDRKRWKNPLFTSAILLLILSVFLLNIVAIQLEKRYALVGDLTANTAYKVGPETSMVLQSLTKDVHIYVLSEETSFTGDAYLVQANLMMKTYPTKSNRVTLSYIDYVLDPTFVSQYPELVIEKGDILVTSGNNTEQIKLSEMFNYERNAAGNVMIVSSRAEEVLTSAILGVMSDDKIQVALLKGNGVANKNDFNTLLTKNGFILQDVTIATDPLDESYDIAMLLAPQVDLSESAISKIDEFLYNDGAYGKMLIYTADVTQEPLPLTEAYLKEWGLQIGDGAVFETKADRTYQSQPFYPVVDHGDNDYSDLLLDPSIPLIMPLARPMQALFKVRDKHFTKNLLIFGSTAGVRPSNAVDFDVDDGVSWGGNPGLVLASKKIAKTDGTGYKQSHILVSASSEMLEAFTIGNTSLGNSEYIIKLLNDSFGKTQSIAIVPKSLAGDILTMNTRQKNIMAWTMVGVIPMCILVVGIAVFAMRRYE